MKKMILAALAACMCVCLCFGIFAACDDRSGNGEQPAEYTITANNGAGYTVDAPASAKDGDTVTVTVTVTNEDTYVTGVTYNEDECDETDGKYTFTMPAENVTIAVQTGTYEEVLSDGNDSLNAYNVYTIAQNGSYSPRVGTDTENVWKILADISWGNTTAFSRYSDVTSSNQSVIPDSAVAIVELDGHDFGQGSSASNLILAADICIDTAKISVGTTWLTIELDSENTSSNCTFVVKVTVVPYGEVPVATEQKTLVIDVSALDASEGDYYTMRFWDNNYIDGGTTKEFFDVTAQVSADDTVSFAFNYARLHKYDIAMTPGQECDYTQTVSIGDKTNGTGTDTLYNGKTDAGLMFWTVDTIELEALAD